MVFAEQLEVGLTLVVGSTTSVVGCGDVERFRVAWHAWGFEAEVTLSTWPERGPDALFELLTGTDLVQARLEVKSARAPTPGPDPLVANGIVTAVEVVEHVLEQVSGRPVRRREIALRFADAAQVLWRQHFPCELSADAPLGEVIDRQLAGGMLLERSWSRLDLEQPLVCLGCGGDGVRGGSSFYDFILWYTDTHAGVFTYDASTAKYSLAPAKPRTMPPGLLPAADAARVRVVAPRPARHALRVLDGRAAGPQTVAVANALAVTGLRRDVLALPPTAGAFDELKAIETSRLAAAAEGARLDLDLARFPTVTLRPGLSMATPATSGWSSRTWAANKLWRVYDVELEGGAPAAPGDESGLTARTYELGGRVQLEREDDPAQRLPPFARPVYPLYVQGKIVAEGGEDGDRRWQVVESERAGGSIQTVDVLLWNAKIPVPFVPGHLSGHLFFPPHKGTTVLVELGLHEARLVRLLDWGADVRLPIDGQGNHILFGFNATSQTSIAHDYADNEPRLVVKRSHGKDLGTVSLEEGVLTIEVKEDDSATEASETFDVTLQVELARGELRGQIGAGIGELSAKFSGASTALTGSIGDAGSEVQGQLQSTADAVGGKVDEASARIEELRGDLQGAAAPVTAAARAAIAELKAAAR